VMTPRGRSNARIAARCTPPTIACHGHASARGHSHQARGRLLRDVSVGAECWTVRPLCHRRSRAATVRRDRSSTSLRHRRA
jgi:hypothetical protein